MCIEHPPESVTAQKATATRVGALLLVLAAHPVGALGLWWADQSGLVDLLGPGKTPGYGLSAYLLLLGFIAAACRVPVAPLGLALLAYAVALGLDLAYEPLLELSYATGLESSHLLLVAGIFPVLVGGVLTYNLPRIPWMAKSAFWAAGIYIAAVHVYNGLDAYGTMGLFWGGEQI